MPTATANSPSIQDQAKQLGLGVVALTPELVAAAPGNILPLAVVEASRIFPYQLDGVTQVLSVAVADPTQLKQAAPVELQAQRKLGRRLKLALVEPTTFDELLPAIRSRLSKQQAASSKQQADTGDDGIGGQESRLPLAASSLPTVDLAAVTIPRAVLLKIPHDVATKFRLIAFSAPSATRVKLATDRPHDPGVARVIDVIRAKRGVAVELHVAAGSQIDDVIDAYAASTDPILLVTPSVPKTVTVAGQTANGKPRAVPAEAPSVPAAAVTATSQAAQPAMPKTPPAQPPIDAPDRRTQAADRPATAPSTAPTPTSSSPITASPAATKRSGWPTTLPAPKIEDRQWKIGQPMPRRGAAFPDMKSGGMKPGETVPTAMPVDTSPVTRPLPAAKTGKIQLAAPLPSFAASPLASPTVPTEVVSQLASSQQPAASSTPHPPTVVPVPASVSIPPRTPLPLPSAPVAVAPVAAPSVIDPRSPVLPSQSRGNPASSPPASPAGGQPPASTLTTLGPVAAEDQNLDTTVGSTIRSPAELEAVAKTGLIPKLLAGILQYAVNTGASDIHIEAETGDLRIRFRIDGQLRDILKAPLGLHAPLASRLKILAKMKIDEQRVPQDGRFSGMTANREIDFRVSTLPAIHGEKVVLRILDKSVSLKPIDQLGIDGVNGQRVTAALAKPFGILLVTGPTGSGKTTTLYAMLASVNQPGVNIVTLEDPVEYELPGITQTQVKPKIGFGFAEGLRSILRQDPDVIMVGEIRDRETASLATHAALTGHLVLSTLHTNTAAGAIPRFLDMGVEPFLIASSMEAVIGQRLVRKLCERCRQPAQLSAAVQQDIQAELARSSVAEVKARATQPLQLLSPNGCGACHDGYKGRLGIYEVMSVTPEIETLTAKKAPLTEIEQLAIQQGMVTMKQDGIMKALAGLTSIDEILRVTTSD